MMTPMRIERFDFVAGRNFRYLNPDPVRAPRRSEDTSIPFIAISNKSSD